MTQAPISRPANSNHFCASDMNGVRAMGYGVRDKVHMHHFSVVVRGINFSLPWWLGTQDWCNVSRISYLEIAAQGTEPPVAM